MTNECITGEAATIIELRYLLETMLAKAGGCIEQEVSRALKLLNSLPGAASTLDG